MNVTTCTIHSLTQSSYFQLKNRSFCQLRWITKFRSFMTWVCFFKIVSSMLASSTKRDYVRTLKLTSSTSNKKQQSTSLKTIKKTRSILEYRLLITWGSKLTWARLRLKTFIHCNRKPWPNHGSSSSLWKKSKNYYFRHSQLTWFWTSKESIKRS